MQGMEQINKVGEDIKSNFEKLGLYMIDFQVATSDADAVSEDGEEKEDFRKKLADGESVWMLQTTFTIGSQAFTDRVLNPEKDKEDTEFQVIMPTEIEMIRERMREKGLAAFEPDEED